MSRARRLAAALVMVASVVLPARTRSEGAAAPAHLEAFADTYDAGRVEVGTRVTHTYELRNRGTRPLQLAVRASCGCTTTDFDEVIPAGGTGKVSAALDTTHVRGRVTKTLRVTTNDPTQPALTLSLIVETIRLLDVLPTDQPILRGPIGGLKPMTLTITAPDAAPFTILRVEDDPVLTTTLQPEDHAGAATSEHQRYQLTLSPKRDLAVGTYTPTLTLVTTRPKAERFELRTMIVVTGPLAAMPPTLSIRSAATPVSVRILTQNTETSFRVLHVESTDPDFTPQFAAVAGDHAFDVTLRYTGNPTRRGPVNAVLKITTDEPTQPLLLVHFSGQL